MTGRQRLFYSWFVGLCRPEKTFAILQPTDSLALCGCAVLLKPGWRCGYSLSPVQLVGEQAKYGEPILSADIDATVGHDWDRELDGVPRHPGTARGAAKEQMRDVGSIVGV